MNRNNNSNEALNNISNIRKEVSRLCDIRSANSKGFRDLGFDCLLRKLKEIEQILNGLKEISIIDQGSPLSSTRVDPVLKENMDGHHPDGCRMESRPNVHSLTLPDDLTAHTKFVLNEIFSRFEKSMDQFYESAKLKFKQGYDESFRMFDFYMNTFREKQKNDLRMYIENMLELEMVDGPLPSDSLFSDISPIPHHRSSACPARSHPQSAVPPTSTPVPFINMAAVKETLACPGVDPCLKQQFFHRLKGIDDLLADIMNQADCSNDSGYKELPADPPNLDLSDSNLDNSFQPLKCNR